MIIVMRFFLFQFQFKNNVLILWFYDFYIVAEYRFKSILILIIKI